MTRAASSSEPQRRHPALYLPRGRRRLHRVGHGYLWHPRTQVLFGARPIFRMFSGSVRSSPFVEKQQPTFVPRYEARLTTAKAHEPLEHMGTLRSQTHHLFHAQNLGTHQL